MSKKLDFTCGKMRRNAPIFSIAGGVFSIFSGDFMEKMQVQSLDVGWKETIRSESMPKSQEVYNL